MAEAAFCGPEVRKLLLRVGCAEELLLSPMEEVRSAKRSVHMRSLTSSSKLDARAVLAAYGRRFPWRPVVLIAVASAALAFLRGSDVDHSLTASAAVAKALGERGIACTEDDVVWAAGPSGLSGALLGGGRALVRAVDTNPTADGEAPSPLHDLFLVDVRLAPERLEAARDWQVLGVGAAWNLTNSADADEQRPVLHVDPELKFAVAAFTTEREGRTTSIHTLDSHGRRIGGGRAAHEARALPDRRDEPPGDRPARGHRPRRVPPLVADDREGAARVARRRAGLGPSSGPPRAGRRARRGPRSEGRARPRRRRGRRSHPRDRGRAAEARRVGGRPSAPRAVHRERHDSMAEGRSDDDGQRALVVLRARRDRGEHHRADGTGRRRGAGIAASAAGLHGPRDWLATGAAHAHRDEAAHRRRGALGEHRQRSLRDPSARRAGSVRPHFSAHEPQPPRRDGLHHALGPAADRAAHGGGHRRAASARRASTGSGHDPADAGGDEARRGRVQRRLPGAARRVRDAGRTGSSTCRRSPTRRRSMELRDGSDAFGAWPGRTSIPDEVARASARTSRRSSSDGERSAVFNPWGRTWWGGTPPGWADTDPHRAERALPHEGRLRRLLLQHQHLPRRPRAGHARGALHASRFTST